MFYSLLRETLSQSILSLSLHQNLHLLPLPTQGHLTQPVGLQQYAVSLPGETRTPPTGPGRSPQASPVPHQERKVF